MQAKASSSRKVILIESVVLTLVFIGIVLYAVLFGMTKKENASKVNITYQGELLYSLPLSENKDINIATSDGPLLIRIEEGGVRVVSSPCANHFCVSEGIKSKIGESIVCAPEGVGVYLVGGEVGEINL